MQRSIGWYSQIIMTKSSFVPIRQEWGGVLNLKPTATYKYVDQVKYYTG